MSDTSVAHRQGYTIVEETLQWSDGSPYELIRALEGGEDYRPIAEAFDSSRHGWLITVEHRAREVAGVDGTYPETPSVHTAEAARWWVDLIARLYMAAKRPSTERVAASIEALAENAASGEVIAS